MKQFIENIAYSQFAIGLMAGVVVTIFVSYFIFYRKYNTSQVSLNFPFGLGNITLDATNQTRLLAWKIYIQLKTRKASLPFDEEHDVIIDILKSLDEIFPVAREILSQIKPYVECQQMSVSDCVLRVLNDGIRPYLTQWNSRYRKWWDSAIENPSNKMKSPQEIQREFPEYDKLISDLKKMNDELTKYADELLIIVYSPPTSKINLKKMPSRISEQPQIL